MISPLRHRLLIDLQATQSQAFAERGVANYVRNQVRALARRGVGDAYLLNPLLPFPKALDQDLLASPLLRWNTQTEVRSIVRSGDGPIAFFWTSPIEMSLRSHGDLPPHLLRGSIPVVATIYDLIQLAMADRFLANPVIDLTYRTRLEQLHQIDKVLTISGHTRREVIEKLGLPADRVVDVGTGVSPWFRPPLPGEDPKTILRRDLPAITRPYVFCQSGDSPSKNPEGLIEAYALLPRDVRAAHQLVITCSLEPHRREAWLALAGRLGLGEGELVLTGYVAAEVLRALYQHAVVTVAPSLQEGFGLPVVESAACGTAALTSDRSSLPEILDLPESTFDPTDAADMAGVVNRALTDDAFRVRLVQRGAERLPRFSWDAVADRTIAAMATLPEPPTGVTELPRRIALVGPMPPRTSGIADYNARLLPALAKRAEVDVFSPDHHARAVDLDGVHWFPPRALHDACSPWSYDTVIYTAGNSDDHHELYDLAQEYPGLLWLHDVRLPGLYITYAEERFDDDEGEDFLRERLLRQYRRRLPRTIDPSPNALWPQWVEHGIGLTKELVDVARGTIVSSAMAERLLELDQQPDGAPRRSWVLPLGLPAPWGDDRHRAPAAAPVLAAFGLVAPVKGPEVLLPALALLRRAGVPAEVVLVGPVGEGYRQHLLSIAAAHGVEAHVSMTGRVGADEYRWWLERATVAVQLRLSTNGESSAAVTDCLAAGVPTVTNVVAADELPEGAVARVPFDVDPATLAGELARLVADDAARTALSARGRAHAAAWSMEDVADRLVAIVDSLSDPHPVPRTVLAAETLRFRSVSAARTDEGRR